MALTYEISHRRWRNGEYQIKFAVWNGKEHVVTHIRRYVNEPDEAAVKADIEGKALPAIQKALDSSNEEPERLYTLGEADAILKAAK